MDRRFSSLVLACLFLMGSFPIPLLESLNAEHSDASKNQYSSLQDSFLGFHSDSNDNIWNLSNWSNISQPNGFDFLTVYDYSDVGVLINNRSEASRTIGWAFVNARNIPLENIFFFNNTSTPTKETINRDQFNTYFANPFLEMLFNRTSTTELNYLVSTKGIPLRISGGENKASFDQEFSLLGGTYASSIDSNYWVDHGYGPLAGATLEAFSREKYGFYLMTRLTGYTVDTALGLIEKANNSLGERGVFALDLATNRNGSGYKFWNDDLYVANSTLNGSLGLPTHFDQTSNFLTNVSNVMGYASWGSNDDSWGDNWLPNAGFETGDVTYSSGAQFWNTTVPSLSSGDSFNWSTQSNTTESGSNALEASISAVCTQEAGNGTQGILAEFFDNDGVSFSTSSMPSLIDRVPDHIRLENSLQYSSSSQAYTGLDNRFKNDWGARFSGLIEVPETGNWTFFLKSDDGSELWIDGLSLVTNHGSHGMREHSQYIQLDQGKHDFRIEFFQGGGPHGLQLSWQGPNQSKALIPPSAFSLASEYIPSESNLIHHWDFEEGSGNYAFDSANESTNFTLKNMNSSNWRTCVDGSCLWYDGVDDSLEVDVEDWVGNFTVSQWVWANSTTLPNYASVFAVDNAAGSNGSFQHAIFNGEWRLHNNQTNAFGDVRAQEWTHLVTVFENGNARQYYDGVLVRTTTFPAGSFNNFDLYKLGVNRAGSTFFEGMIDNVMIWDVALQDHEITTLNRDIYQDCDAYSGNGQDVASIEQTYTIPSKFKNHAWLISAESMRIGDVFGDFTLEIDAYDSNGNLVSSNQSASKNFAKTWESQSMRFRPSTQAANLVVRINLDIVATSTDGSVFLDSLNMHPILPHNVWVNGSIAETAVSTGGRSFNIDTSYGQSLVADLLEDGVSGVKGYVYEPYLTAVGSPSVLMNMYAQGFNLAEAHAAANLQTSWMGVTVGDPKMAPFADQIHDVNLFGVRQFGNASYLQPSQIQLALENKGMSASNGTILVENIQGNVELYRGNLTLPAGNESGSRILHTIEITPQTTGWMDLRIRYLNTSNERIKSNNLDTLRFWVNAPPVVEDLYCDSQIYARGDNFICTVEASDDQNVTSVQLEWAVVSNVSNLTGAIWNVQNTGRVDQLRWQTSVLLPSSLSLGTLVLRATAYDVDMQQGFLESLSAATVVDAQAQWFGPHFSGVDSSSWTGVNQLPYQPIGSMYRGESTDWKICAVDADFNSTSQLPLLSASEGYVSTMSYQPQVDSNHHCYVGSYLKDAGTSLDAVSFEVRSTDGVLLTSRIVNIGDRLPTANIEIHDGNGSLLDSVRGGGGEYVRILIDDTDDPSTSATGDLHILWPGSEKITVPVDIQNISLPIELELPTIETPLESGELVLQLEITGQNGAFAAEDYTSPFLLTTPNILSANICNDDGPIETLRFGSSAYMLVHLESERPIKTSQATLSQLGWSVAAPSLGEISPSDTSIQNCLEFPELGPSETIQKFRLRLDGTFIDGEGQILFSVRDVDGLVKSLNIGTEFYHAMPSTNLEPIQNARAGEMLSFNGTVEDADGIEDLQCVGSILQGETLIADLQVSLIPLSPTKASFQFQFPTTNALNNATLNASISCSDSWLQSDISRLEVFLLPELPCESCNQTNSTLEASQSTNIQIPIVIGIILLLSVIVASIALKRRSKVSEIPLWGEHEVELDAESDSVDVPEQSELKIPKDWSEEQYASWLEGEMPEGWQLLQWMEFTDQQLALLDSIRESRED